MIWSEFKAEVDKRTPRNKKRHNMDDFKKSCLVDCAIKLQGIDGLEYLRPSVTKIFTLPHFASSGVAHFTDYPSMTGYDDLEIEDLWIFYDPADYPDADVSPRQRCERVSYARVNNLIAGSYGSSTRHSGWAGVYAFDPDFTKLGIYPQISDAEAIYVACRGVKYSFDDSDEVVFTTREASAFATYTDGMFALVVDHSETEYSIYMAAFYREIRALISDRKTKQHKAGTIPKAIFAGDIDTTGTYPQPNNLFSELKILGEDGNIYCVSIDVDGNLIKELDS